MKAVYRSDGLLWERGDGLPECAFCQRPITPERPIFETVLSGYECCTDDNCRLALAMRCCISEIEKV
jgi:hypothetical protein